MAKEEKKQRQAEEKNPKEASGFGTFSATIEPETNIELDQERARIEQIKNNENNILLSAQEFDEKARKAQLEVQRANSNDFNFKAGIDPSTGERYFNVVGVADPSHIYRGASMKKGKQTYYFFGESYDALYVLNNEKQLTVNAWSKDDKRWEKSPIAKNELSTVSTITIEEASKIHHEIRSQGDDPSI